MRIQKSLFWGRFSFRFVNKTRKGRTGKAGQGMEIAFVFAVSTLVAISLLTPHVL